MPCTVALSRGSRAAAATDDDAIYEAWERSRESLTANYKRAYRKMLARKRRKLG